MKNLIVIMAFLCSCTKQDVQTAASTRNEQATRIDASDFNMWLGHSKIDLIKEMGEPSRSNKVADMDLLSYDNKYTSLEKTIKSPDGSIITTIPPREIKYSLTFYIRSGIVINVVFVDDMDLRVLTGEYERTK